MTSLVGRFPAFDYMEVEERAYLWIKKQITFATDSSGRSVYILPTDDERLKFVIFEQAKAPEECLDKVVSRMLG